MQYSTEVMILLVDGLSDLNGILNLLFNSASSKIQKGVSLFEILLNH